MIVMILVVTIETLIKYSIWHMLVYSLLYNYIVNFFLSIVCALLVRGANNFEPTVSTHTHKCINSLSCLFFADISSLLKIQGSFEFSQELPAQETKYA